MSDGTPGEARHADHQARVEQVPEHQIVVAGFGGQGVLFAGLVLAHAALSAGREVAWIPFYGPEMRGGTAGCSVVISDESIGSPIVARPTAAIVLNEPSLAKWAPRVRTGGVLVVNATLATATIERTDVRVIALPASGLARELGNERTANLVALGALVAASGLLSLDAVERGLIETLGTTKAHLLDVNRAAFSRGVASVAAP
jgi:2-oxoglutarate ferredoxin oxidoreductase subunit gamma